MFTPLDIARGFAAIAPGARVEEPRQDLNQTVFARVHFTHLGQELRLVIYKYDMTSIDVWLETRAVGIFGRFDLVRTPALTDAAATAAVPKTTTSGEYDDDDEDGRDDDDDDGEDDDDETDAEGNDTEGERFFLSERCYVSGHQVRQELARIQTLSDEDRARFLDLCAKVELIKLESEVLSLRFCDVFGFKRWLERAGGPASLLEVSHQLSLAARSLPALGKELAELSEARKCRYCEALFLFSARSPVCARCGAPADALTVPPPHAARERPQDDPEYCGYRNEQDLESGMAAVRELTRRFCALLPQSQVREQREFQRAYIEYELDGRSYRCKIHDDYVGIRTLVPHLKGSFYLSWSDADLDDGGLSNELAWREEERRIFFSKHLRVSSRKTSREAARLATLPAPARALLVRLCEQNEQGCSLGEGELALGIGLRANIEQPSFILEHTRHLSTLADAFPADFNDEAPARLTLAACQYCRTAYFREAGQFACARCGAPADPIPA